jgi:ankyrin repeat protein
MSDEVDNVNPIYKAILQKDLKLVITIINNLKDLNQHQSEGNTLLGIAVIYSVIEIIELFISKGADVNFPDKNGITPIMLAAAWHKTGVVELLKKAGADLTIADDKGWTYLEYYASAGNVEAIKSLANANNDFTSPSGQTILQSVIIKEDYHAVKILLAAGAGAAPQALDVSISDKIKTIVDICYLPTRECLEIICPENEDMQWCASGIVGTNFEIFAI